MEPESPKRETYKSQDQVVPKPPPITTAALVDTEVVKQNSGYITPGAQKPPNVIVSGKQKSKQTSPVSIKEKEFKFPASTHSPHHSRHEIEEEP